MNSQSRILAMDLGGTYIKYGLFDQQGVLLEKGEALSAAEKGGDTLLVNALGIAKKLSGFSSIGISTNGIINPEDGSVIFANDNVPNLTGVSLRGFFEENLGVPVLVEGDVNAAAIGEMHLGVAQGFENFVCLTFGTGIGGSLIIDGKVFRGAHNVAGEMGHIISHPNGLHCACGVRGCFEQYASVNALIKAAQRIDKKYIDGKVIFSSMLDQPKLQKVVDLWINEIIYGLATIIHMLNPTLIVLGGGIMSEEYIMAYLKDNLHRFIMPCHHQTKLASAKLGNLSSVYGMMVLVKQSIENNQNANMNSLSLYA